MTSEAPSSSKGTRSKPFTAGEVEKLKSEFEKRKSILDAPHSAKVTNTVKKLQWVQVALEVNKVGPYKRTHEDVRRKWENLKCSIKRKLADEYKKGHLTRTGGGSPTGHAPTDEDERMLSIIGKDMVFGLIGGFDSSQQSGSNTIQKLMPIGENETLSDLEELPEVEVIHHLDTPTPVSRRDESVAKGAARANITGKPKPKNMGELVVAAQEDICIVLEKTNELLEASILAQKMYAESISEKMDTMVALKKEEVELMKKRLEFEMKKHAYSEQD